MKHLISLRSRPMAEPGELTQGQRDQLLTQMAGNLSIIKDELVLRRVREDGKALAEQAKKDREVRLDARERAH